jgi:hypothetical protein
MFGSTRCSRAKFVEISVFYTNDMNQLAPAFLLGGLVYALSEDIDLDFGSKAA